MFLFYELVINYDLILVIGDKYEMLLIIKDSKVHVAIRHFHSIFILCDHPKTRGLMFNLEGQGVGCPKMI